MSVAVVVGRFQIDSLHAGHYSLLRYANREATKLMIVVGVAPVLMSEKDPLDFQSRAQMLKQEFPDAIIVPHKDRRGDVEWSEALDKLISDTFPLDKVKLYASRDSFKPHYHGKYDIEEIQTVPDDSATKRRALLAATPIDSASFRAGVIYASQNRYPHVSPTVDVAVVKKGEHGETLILLGKKPGENAYRFIGGFVEPFESLERAAKRELAEEVGLIETSSPQYVISIPVNDWRYCCRKDQVLSSLFVVDYNYGLPTAADDIEAVGWFMLQQLDGILTDEHKPFLGPLVSFLEKR